MKVRHDKWPAAGDTTPQSGIALVIVMIAVLVLGVLAGGFAWSMKVETTLARNANSEEELQWLGRSGVEYAKWVLAMSMTDPTKPYDSPDQAWATAKEGDLVGPTNNAIEVHNPVFLGHGNFTWKITDLESKFNINSPEPLLQQILPQALTVMGADPSESPTVVNSILDWIDPDDQPHIDGAETDYYQGLSSPYYCKNGPIDDIAELQLIKGVTPEMYAGSAFTNYQAGDFRRMGQRFGFGSPGNNPGGYSIGLPKLFTPISDGKLNANTISKEVWQVIVNDEALAEALVAGRQGEDDGTGLLGPYRNLQDIIVKVPTLPRAGPEFTRISQFCEFRSRSFEVHVTAQIGNYQREFIAIVARNSPRDVQTLTFYWK